MKRTSIALIGTGLTALALNAHAVPILQIYVEGATYDTATQTWVGTDTGGPIRLWTIGNVSGPGGKGTIEDVKLAIAYAAGDDPTITVTPSTTMNFGGYTDPVTPSAPTLIQTSTDGSVPKLGDGSSLSSHGIYGADTWWKEYALGDFDLENTPIADFTTSFPASPDCISCGQINVYEIVASGTEWLHFDLYDHVVAGSHAQYKFAPFSHDGESGTTTRQVPEPHALGLLGLGLLGLAAANRRRRHTS